MHREPRPIPDRPDPPGQSVLDDARGRPRGVGDRRNTRGLRFEELARDSICLAVAPKHPLAQRRAITMAEAAREPLIAYSRKDYPEYHEYLAALFAPTKSKPHVTEEHDSVTSLIAAVEAGSGVAFVPESLACIAGSRLKLISLSPVPEPLVVGVAWPKARLDSVAERFLKSAREVASNSDS